ncbi:MAG: DNA topoisomerase VI subunit B, partial [Archaeoglobaceae archaeon]|nr:DNA topoisomerase VI subunit B [Archaeoglobaceae archaeon]MDW8118842.1 DNA topoisomerase VI subunit B [Archaeoglobaceae archaeon]
DPLEVDRIVARIMGYLHVERQINERDGLKEVKVIVSNFTKAKREIKVVETCSGEVEAENAKISGGSYPTISWNLSLNPNEEVELRYLLKGKVINKTPIVEGVDNTLLSTGNFSN